MTPAGGACNVGVKGRLLRLGGGVGAVAFALFLKGTETASSMAVGATFTLLFLGGLGVAEALSGFCVLNGLLGRVDREVVEEQEQSGRVLAQGKNGFWIGTLGAVSLAVAVSGILLLWLYL